MAAQRRSWLPWVALSLVAGVAAWLAFQTGGGPEPAEEPAPAQPEPAETPPDEVPQASLEEGTLPGAGPIEVDLRFLGGEEEERTLAAPGGRLEGLVVDQGGNPLPDARLIVIGGPQDGWIALGDRLGRYLFPALLPGTQFFRIEVPGRPPVAREQRVLEHGRTQRDFEVGDPVPLLLLVRGSDGKPLAGARVRVDLGQQELVTAADGLAAFGAVPSGPRVLVDVIAPGHVPTRHELNLLPAAQAGPGPVELPVLERGGVVQGVVKSWPGGPLPTVTLMPRADRPETAQVIWEIWHDVPTGADGRFRLVDVPTTRTVDVRVAHPEGVADPPLRSVRAAPEAGAFVEFLIRRGDDRIAGLVLGPDGKPLSGARVVLEAADPLKVLAAEYPGLGEGPLAARIPVPPSLRRELRTGSDGRFDFAWGDHREGTGTFLLRASKEGLAPARVEIRSVRSNITLRLQPEQRDGSLRLLSLAGAPVDVETRWFLDGQPLDAPRGLARGYYEIRVQRGEHLLYQSAALLVGPETFVSLKGQV
ncbi:MAG: carboxypeptidase regulatory-like domain-containing protein [Planctomycetota bacterium]|nr:MAG: carboxypeptidase regulatory-like domain-containing protein [Planctomycetota bacterium]